VDWLYGVDWQEVFKPETPLLETFVRGSVTYLAIVALLRIVLKREAGAVGITDLLVLVLLADAAQNAMAGDYRSIPDGVLLVAVIVGWDYTLNMAAYHSRWLDRLIKPAPLAVVKDGEPLWTNMRREYLTHEELLSALRLHGVEDITHVERAYIEPDGRFSVITRRQQPNDTPDRRPGG
jgi:uncharacterized membrane protein YcaP (DUF421 family)